MFAALPAFRKHSDNSYYNSVGASGAVAAVLFSFILFMPTTSLYLMFIPIPIPAFVFGILYLALEAYLDKRSQDNVAHDAHIWGAIFGVAFTIVMKPSVVLSFIEEVSLYVTHLL